MVLDWENYTKISAYALFGFYFQLPTMCFDDIITQTQSQSCSFGSFFGGEEGLEDFVFDGGGNAGAVVGDACVIWSRVGFFFL